MPTIPDIRARVAAVREQHRRFTPVNGYCMACDLPYPCDAIALADLLDGLCKEVGELAAAAQPFYDELCTAIVERDDWPETHYLMSGTGIQLRRSDALRLRAALRRAEQTP